MLLCLWGCTKEHVKSYSYCAVDQVETPNPRNKYVWIAHCSGSGAVVFHSEVKAGDGIYFSPYYEDDDAVTTHGYIEEIQKVVP